MHTLLVPRAGQSQYCCSAAPAHEGRVEALSVEAELLQEGRKKSGGNLLPADGQAKHGSDAPKEGPVHLQAQIGNAFFGKLSSPSTWSAP
ncbi:hypothetical protein AX14_002834 [Amanita brunnescens Koide BX004]|nr:hypothetical protein AX14_002834 [Amanita brunnescens Koide BX004]